MSIHQSFFLSSRTSLAFVGLLCAMHYSARVDAQTAATLPTSRMTLQTSNAQEITWQQVVQKVAQNLDVQMSAQQVAASRADLIAADHAPAPVLSAKVSSIDLQNGIGAGHPVTQKRLDKSIGVDWVWERGNKRVLRTAAAQSGIEAAKADLLDVQMQQKLAASAAFFELAAAQERVERVQAMEQSASELLHTAQRRVQAGDLAAQDAQRVDIEYRRSQGETLSAKLDWRKAMLNLQALLSGFNTTNSIAACAISTCENNTNAYQNAQEIHAKADWPSLDAQKTVWSLPEDSQFKAWLDQRPDLMAAAHRLRIAQTQLDAALALKKADVTWGASYDHFPGTSNKLFELRMQMPIQWDVLGGYNYAGEEQKARIAVQQAQTNLEKIKFLAQNEYQRLIQEISFTQSRLRNYALDILPRAKQVETNAELAYSKGALSLTDLIEARRTLRATQLEALSAKLDYTKAYFAWQIRTATSTTTGKP